jgi:hypothetical protein
MLMSGTNQSEWDLDELKDRIRAQAAEMRERVESTIPLPSQGLSAWSFNWLEVKSRLKIAAGLTRLGEMPLLPRFHGFRRRLALIAARGVLILTRFLTNRQSEFNACLIESVREMGLGLHALEKRVLEQQEQIHRLENTIAQLQMRLPSATPRTAERKAS